MGIRRSGCSRHCRTFRGKVGCISNEVSLPVMSEGDLIRNFHQLLPLLKRLRAKYLEVPPDG